MKTMNEMNVLELFVYKDEKFRWVFDDEEHHLAQEAFVAGMDAGTKFLGFMQKRTKFRSCM